jgi:hypothetical protein
LVFIAKDLHVHLELLPDKKGEISKKEAGKRRLVFPNHQDLFPVVLVASFLYGLTIDKD